MPIRFNLCKYNSPGSVFIETGLWRCEGVEKAIRAGFKKIISIEIDKKIFRAGQKRLAKHIESGRVSLLLGNSEALMGSALSLVPDSKIVFWLDGHYQGVGQYEANPLYSELESIGRHRRKDHTILIDDRRLFRSSTWNVDESLVKRIISQVNPQYRFCCLRGHISNDVLCAYVPSVKEDRSDAQ